MATLYHVYFVLGYLGHLGVLLVESPRPALDGSDQLDLAGYSRFDLAGYSRFDLAGYELPLPVGEPLLRLSLVVVP